MNERGIRRVEDLDVFGRAYRLSLELHRASLKVPRIEQFALARPVAPRIEIDLRELGRGFRQAGLFCGGVSALSVGRDWQ